VSSPDHRTLITAARIAWNDFGRDCPAVPRSQCRGHRFEYHQGVIRTITLLLLSAAVISAQQFEVASIKLSDQNAQSQAVSAGIHIDGAMVRYSSVDLKIIIGAAWGVRNYQISAPDWMAAERWNITAKLPDGSDRKQIPAMVQALLRDRFQMKTHRETRELPVYGLVVARNGLKLKETPGDEAADAAEPPKPAVNVGASAGEAGTMVNYGNGAYFTIGSDKLEGRKIPISVLADILARFAHRPVVDMTGLKGSYDFTMEFSPEDFRAMMIRAAVAQGSVLPPEVVKLADASSGDSLFNAVEKLGLKLEVRKAPIEMLIVDQALKTPTDN
jgi:uncharacterized protein (TIGR03435 family)